jgi:Fur family peroxide stress response transcriptional regulator
MQTQRRKSRQRERILQAIMASKAHPTAQEVYGTLKRELPRLSLGNVYRNIGILLEEERIVSGEFGNGTVRYDATVNGHYHFVCEECGSVSDMQLPVQDGLMAAARKLSRNIIVSHTIRFFGICALCAQKSRDMDDKSNIKTRR